MTRWSKRAVRFLLVRSRRLTSSNCPIAKNQVPRAQPNSRMQRTRRTRGFSFHPRPLRRPADAWRSAASQYVGRRPQVSRSPTGDRVLVVESSRREIEGRQALRRSPAATKAGAGLLWFHAAELAVAAEPRRRV